jgi:transposase
MGDRRGQYPRELRERAVRLVLESRDQYESEWAAMASIAAKLGIGTTETLRKWVRQAEVDAGERAGTTSEESAELKRLKREVAELRRANEILKAAAGFFASVPSSGSVRRGSLVSSLPRPGAGGLFGDVRPRRAP